MGLVREVQVESHHEAETVVSGRSFHLSRPVPGFTGRLDPPAADGKNGRSPPGAVLPRPPAHQPRSNGGRLPEGPGSRRGEMGESACKPGSVVDSHSSGAHVAVRLERPTRERRGPRHCSPIWSCSGWGLPCRRVLPPARCALTAPFHPCRRPGGRFGGLFSVALSVGSRRPGVTWHPALWSPDFPPRPQAARLSGRLPQALYQRPAARGAIFIHCEAPAGRMGNGHRLAG